MYITIRSQSKQFQGSPGKLATAVGKLEHYIPEVGAIYRKHSTNKIFTYKWWFLPKFKNNNMEAVKNEIAKIDFVKWGLPSRDILRFDYGKSPIPQSPFESEFLTLIFNKSMNVATPMTIALVYFSLVHYINPKVVDRQVRKSGQSEKNGKSEKSAKKLPAAPVFFTKHAWFKLFVIIHNLFLCIYSAWTFGGMLVSINNTKKLIRLNFENYDFKLELNFQSFFQSVCDVDNGLFNLNLPFNSLMLYGWWFYVSKFYEVLDTVIILLKGRPSLLLQSYHHAGAMMCMWAGIRFQSPPIWIFVVFNSFIHTLMYFYFTLSCLKIRVPVIFKRVLTSMQITQFVVGGSLALLHSFIYFTDMTTNTLINCISTPDQALPLIINVSYLTPLTMLFAAFYVDSYLKRKT